MTTPKWDLDTSILKLSGGNVWTIRDSCQHLLCVGGTGAGKSSSSGRTIALKFLQTGYGGLVLTVKPDEKQQWIDYCKEAGRLQDLVVFEPGGPYAFNFLDYESTTKGEALTYTENIVSLLVTVIKAGKDKWNTTSNDEFWDEALRLTISNAIDLCLLAYGRVTVKMLYDIVLSAPKMADQKPTTDEGKDKPFIKAFNIAQEKVNEKINAWSEKQHPLKIEFLQKQKKIERYIEMVFPEARKVKSVYDYFIQQYRTLSDKTRSIIDYSFVGFLSRFMQEPIFSLFCSNSTNITPEASLEGKIILLNLPVKTYDEAGRFAQILFKLIWQRSVERRNTDLNGRPVFMWADECQYLLHQKDQIFLTTSRSSRVATVYITQNLSNLFAHMGGQQAEHTVKSLIGTMGTKLFHANSDSYTNTYASELIGEYEIEDESRNQNFNENFSFGKSYSWKFRRYVRPEEFISLKTGGPENGYMCQAYIHRQGTPFSERKNHRLVEFNQHFKLKN